MTMTDLTGIEAVLANWPEKLPRRGVAAAMQGEQIVFADFSTGHGCVLLQRATPDAMGGREVILPYSQVAGIKLMESLSPKMLEEMGFKHPAP